MNFIPSADASTKADFFAADSRNSGLLYYISSQHAIGIRSIRHLDGHIWDQTNDHIYLSRGDNVSNLCSMMVNDGHVIFDLAACGSLKRVVFGSRFLVQDPNPINIS